MTSHWSARWASSWTATSGWSGDLVTRNLIWDDVHIRDYGDAAVAVGVHTQQASYRGTPADGRFRATHLAVRRDGRWLLAGIHLSRIGGPPPFAGSDLLAGVCGGKAASFPP